MADKIAIDTSELTTLAVDLGRVPAAAVPAAEAVMKRGAQNVKTQMQDRFAGSPHFKGVRRSVSYDRSGLLGITYEVGPDRDRHPGGALAGIAVDGGANGGGGTVKIDDLADAEAPALEREMLKAIEGIL